MAKYYLAFALVVGVCGATAVMGMLSFLATEAQACSSPPCPGK